MDNEKELFNKDGELRENSRFHVNLSLDEKIKCLEEILGKLKKILYVYEKTQEPESNYNYKIFCGGILIYISSSNILFNGELVGLVVNMNSILTNDFDKTQLKRVVFESINQAKHILKGYKDVLKEIEEDGEKELNSSNEEN